MTAAVESKRASGLQAAELEGRIGDWAVDEMSMGMGPWGVKALSADEHELDGPLLVRYEGQRYQVDIQVYVTPVPEPLTPEQEAEQQARELQKAIESSMVPLFDATPGGAS